MDALMKLFLLSAVCGLAGSIFGILVARFGTSDDDRLRVGNASGIGFLVGASIGALIGIFESMIGRL